LIVALRFEGSRPWPLIDAIELQLDADRPPRAA
jgi:hypothetical protein